jgi:hypothetical protein
VLGLVLIEQAAERFDPLMLGIVIGMKLFAGRVQSGDVSSFLFGFQRLATLG